MNTLARIVICCALAAAPGQAMSQTQHPGTDQIQLTVNMVWCYQEQTRVQVPLSVGKAREIAQAIAKASGGDLSIIDLIGTKSDNVIVANIVAASVKHSVYAQAVQVATRAGNVNALRGLYLSCQGHNKRAIEYLQEATDAQVLLAAQHAVACYPPKTGNRYAHNTGNCVGSIDF